MGYPRSSSSCVKRTAFRLQSFEHERAVFLRRTGPRQHHLLKIQIMLMLMKLSALPAQCTRFRTRVHSQEKRRETGQRKPQVLWSVLCRDQCLVMQSGGDRRARHACLLISGVCGGKANFDKKTGVDGKTLIHPNQLVTAKRQTTKMRGHPNPVCATARKRDAGAKLIPAHTCQGHSARRAECNRLGGGSAWNAAQPHGEHGDLICAHNGLCWRHLRHPGGPSHPLAFPSLGLPPIPLHPSPCFSRNKKYRIRRDV